MSTDDRTFSRPRSRAWGDDAQRAVLRAIADDVARRSGHKVAAIEVLRSDGNLEFVAISGNPAAEARLLGKAAPLSLDQMLAFGTWIEGWVHTLGERVDDETRAWMAEYGHTPDAPAPGRPDQWHPEDRLMRLLENEAGELRATLYLDEPLDGLRATPASIAAVNDEIRVMYDAVVSIVERELYREQVRMLSQARGAVASVRPGLGLADFLDEMSEAMVEAMRVDSVDVLLNGASAPALEPHTAELEDQMREVWLRRGHLLMEPAQTWGLTDEAIPTPPVLAERMRARGLASWLIVPIGVGDDYLGTLALGRNEGGARWIDSEIVAADAVAADLAGVVLDSQLMEQERRANEELRDANDARRHMVLTLAHELRNPVSVLWTHLELLDEGADADGDQPFAPAESLAAMDRAARRIDAMVENLMSLASVTDTSRAVPTSPVDLTAVVREAAELLTDSAAASGVGLELELVESVIVHGDQAGLALLVSNLLANAFKYTDVGGLVCMSLAPRTVDGVRGCLLTCADSGIGIAADELAQVFTPFFRSGSPDARRRPGTGLGLAIIDGVVTHHGGTIDVESTLDVGTTFRVWLPLAEPTDVR
ncbi:sensor histidine kinase [Nocardioides hwasunensis]|uniref:histidine kinase n=1 Tax=Nocardioides hwasunensis TaxID=397258 RepID=A0ABR8MMH8_9ACTN|nr:HAMP domain-containing sensor histidine kinase [Nocardioides hwasunensis]MBD3916471.1 HAMP domain-containing histidine kinase [Nocardioides hwasunensis]